MKCTDFAERLNEVLDLRLQPADDRALQAHADTCPECRELLCAEESLFSGLAQLHRRTFAPELGQRVLAELEPTGRKVEVPSFPVPRSPRNWFTLLASAAVVLLALGFGIWVANQKTDQQANGTASSGGKQGSGLAVVKPGVNRRAPAPGLPVIPREEIIAITPPQSPNPSTPPALPGMDQAMASFASHWPQAGQWPPVETLNVQKVEHYAPGIRPIRESFEVALDALLKTLPGKKDTTRPTQPQALQPLELLHIA
jgi:hypothetical protein